MPKQIAFEFQAPAIQQAPTGPQLKSSGTLQVLTNSGAWKDRAARLLDQLAFLKIELTSDDFRAFALASGLEEPHHVNGWGAAIYSAVRRGKLIPTGRFIRSERPDAHSRIVAVWRCVREKTS